MEHFEKLTLNTPSQKPSTLVQIKWRYIVVWPTVRELQIYQLHLNSHHP